MKILIRVIQFAVGILFIVSGLVKANDPLGLSYKMQEFFELWNTGLAAGKFFLRSPLISLFESGHAHSLFLSVTMITLEIVAGVALLVSWKRNFIIWLLLALILFFTFLTGYAYLSGKFTNCGCFGDCLPITPFTSFMKDVVLLVLILVLLFGKRYLYKPENPAVSHLVMAGSLVASLLLQWYVLHYLPVVDCLPFKKGNNIPEQMKPPAGSIPDSFSIRFVYEKNGKRFEFAPENLPADFDTYHYVDRIDKLVRKGNAEPRIKGFSLTGVSGADSTQAVLSLPYAVIVFALEVDNSGSWLAGLKRMDVAARQKGIPVFVACSEAELFRGILEKNGLNIPVFASDFTVMRTAARTNPSIYLLHNGTITGKYSYLQMKDAERALRP
jgi:hypothetical protein